MNDIEKKDPMFWHKVMTIIGGVAGFVLGLIVSKKADEQSYVAVEIPLDEELD